jgi:hypothetical protein
MVITERERLIGRYVREQFGRERTSVFGYGDDTGAYDVSLVSGRDCPQAGVTSYGTVGLFRYPVKAAARDVNIELLGACDSAVEAFANVVTSCAFERMKNGTNLVYGSAIENVVQQYGISRTLPHATFVAPFLWDGFAARSFDDFTVRWLMVLPISDGELAFLRANGIDALESRVEQMQIDVFDIDRVSAI